MLYNKLAWLNIKGGVGVSQQFYLQWLESFLVGGWLKIRKEGKSALT
jgi:hypothetical protein